MSESAADAQARIAEHLPIGFRCVVRLASDGRLVALILSENHVVTVMNPLGDIQDQINEDICPTHGDFCCPVCTDQRMTEVKP